MDDGDNEDDYVMCMTAFEMASHLTEGCAEAVNTGLKLLTDQGRFVHTCKSTAAQTELPKETEGTSTTTEMVPEMPTVLEEALMQLRDPIIKGPRYGEHKHCHQTPLSWHHWLCKIAEDVIVEAQVGDVIQLEQDTGYYHGMRLAAIPFMASLFFGYCWGARQWWHLQGIVSRAGHWTAVAVDRTVLTLEGQTGPSTYTIADGDGGEPVTLLRSELLIGFYLLSCQMASWEHCEWDDLPASEQEDYKRRGSCRGDFNMNPDSGQLVFRDELPGAVHVTVVTESRNTLRVVQLACRTNKDEAAGRFSISVRRVIPLPSHPPAARASDSGVTESTPAGSSGPNTSTTTTSMLPTYMEEKLDLLRWILWPDNPILPPPAETKCRSGNFSSSTPSPPLSSSPTSSSSPSSPSATISTSSQASNSSTSTSASNANSSPLPNSGSLQDLPLR